MSAPWETLLDWWFGTSSDAAEVVAQRNGLWFGKNVCQDADAGGRFGDLVNQALDGGLQEWTAEADGWLALILLLDQLPRMIYRDTPRAYAGDARAQRVVREGLEKGFDRQLPPVRRVFAYLVLEHAEDLPSQERAVACFRDLRDSGRWQRAQALRRFLRLCRAASCGSRPLRSLSPSQRHSRPPLQRGGDGVPQGTRFAFLTPRLRISPACAKL